MKMKLIEIKMIGESFNKIMEANLNIRIAYYLSKLLKIMTQEISNIEEQRIRLVKKYAGTPKEGEEIKVSPDRTMEFQMEFKTLLEEEIEIDFNPIPIADFADDVKLSPVDVIRLEKFIDFEEKEEIKGEKRKLKK